MMGDNLCAVVKPLAWELDARGGWKYGVCTGRNIKIEATIHRVENGWMYCGDIYRMNDTSPLEALEQAKAAAQADYERRILSALTIRPASEVAAEARALAIEEAKDTVGAAIPKNGAGDRLINATRRSSIVDIDALHTDETRAALEKLE